MSAIIFGLAALAFAAAPFVGAERRVRLAGAALALAGGVVVALGGGIEPMLAFAGAAAGFSVAVGASGRSRPAAAVVAAGLCAGAMVAGSSGPPIEQALGFVLSRTTLLSTGLLFAGVGLVLPEPEGSSRSAAAIAVIALGAATLALCTIVPGLGPSVVAGVVDDQGHALTAVSTFDPGPGAIHIAVPVTTAIPYGGPLLVTAMVLALGWWLAGNPQKSGGLSGGFAGALIVSAIGIGALGVASAFGALTPRFPAPLDQMLAQWKAPDAPADADVVLSGDPSGIAFSPMVGAVLVFVAVAVALLAAARMRSSDAEATAPVGPSFGAGLLGLLLVGLGVFVDGFRALSVAQSPASSGVTWLAIGCAGCAALLLVPGRGRAASSAVAIAAMVVWLAGGAW